MFRFIFIILFLIIYFIITIPFVLITLLIGLFNRHTRDILALKCVKLGFHIIRFISGVSVDVYGKENIPSDTPVLYIGNHNGFFDILIGYLEIPTLMGFIAKKEFKKIPGLNWWMHLVNCLFLDREDPREGLKIILQASDDIKSGISIFVFPEGTRSKTGEMGEFKDGTFKIATKSKCPIIPVAFTGTADAFEKQFPCIRPVKITMTFGEAIYTDSLSKEEQKRLSSITKERIQEMLDAKVVS